MAKSTITTAFDFDMGGLAEFDLDLSDLGNFSLEDTEFERDNPLHEAKGISFEVRLHPLRTRRRPSTRY